MRPTPLFRRLVPAVIGGVALALTAGAGVASAHVEPDPATVAAGSRSAVGFTIGHGCNGSPTVKVELKIPGGFLDASPVEIPGWTATSTGDTISWTGGPLDASTPLTFSVELTAPAQAGDYPFPLVQTCETGSIAWVETQAPGAPEPERPVPVLAVEASPEAGAEPSTGAQPPSTSEQAPPASGSEGGLEATSDTGAPAPDAPDSTVAVIAPAPTTTTSASASDDGSNTATIVVVVVVAVLVVGGAAFAVSRRR